jgi:hypothetical protein
MKGVGRRKGKHDHSEKPKDAKSQEANFDY